MVMDRTTGEITVRFDAPPSDAQLQQFAAAHDLVVQRRNEFVAEQVVFSPRLSADLADIIDEVVRVPGVTRAWPNTRSEYRRA